MCASIWSESLIFQRHSKTKNFLCKCTPIRHARYEWHTSQPALVCGNDRSNTLGPYCSLKCWKNLKNLPKMRLQNLIHRTDTPSDTDVPRKDDEI